MSSLALITSYRRGLALRLTCHTGLSLLFEVGVRPPHDGMRRMGRPNLSGALAADYEGGVSKCGDALLRTMLYEAAQRYARRPRTRVLLMLLRHLHEYTDSRPRHRARLSGHCDVISPNS